MRFHSLANAAVSLALFLRALPCTSAQFTFPPPLTRPLADYTAGAATPTLNFSAGDSMLGGWTTPGRLMSFLVYRCTGSTAPGATIQPSNSAFNSTMGHLAPDRTWEQMPLYSSAADMFGNGFNPGDNPIWFHADFLAPNKTTGDLCWFELYPGTDEYTSGPDGSPERVATVNGDGDWYFATEPFTVKPARPTNYTVTWKDGRPQPNIPKNDTDLMAAFQSDFPGLARSTGSASSSKSGGYSVLLQGPGLMGCFALVLAVAL